MNGSYMIKATRLFPQLLPALKRVFPPRATARRLNIGGGRWYLPRWENLDFYADAKFVDHTLDLREMLPIDLPDQCAELAFCSHVLEHLSDEQGEFLVKEVKRLMIPGGTFRIAVPDAEKAMLAYQQGDIDFFQSGGVTCRGEDIEDLLVGFFASYRMDGADEGMRPTRDQIQRRIAGMSRMDFARWCVEQIPMNAPYRAHINAYDQDKMTQLLERVGFTRVERSSFQGSDCPAMRGEPFDNRPRVSLYVEAKSG